MAERDDLDLGRLSIGFQFVQGSLRIQNFEQCGDQQQIVWRDQQQGMCGKFRRWPSDPWMQGF